MTIDKSKVLLCQMYLPQFDEEEKQALTMAIEALEELKAYHEIGTVEECKDAVESIERFYQIGYNMAIDDMEEAILDKLPVVEKDEKVSLIGCVADVMCIVSGAVQKLKEGKNK